MFFILKPYHKNIHYFFVYSIIHIIYFKIRIFSDPAAPGVAAPGEAATGVAAPGVAAPGVAATGVAAPGVAASGVAAPAPVSSPKPPLKLGFFPLYIFVFPWLQNLYQNV